MATCNPASGLSRIFLALNIRKSSVNRIVLIKHALFSGLINWKLNKVMGTETLFLQ
jgi:hypothetical protein